jgi:hypothetical protein
MLVQTRPFAGSFGLAIFVTACLGWLFRGAGEPVPWWLYLVVFALMAAMIYFLARLMRPSGQRVGRVRAFDSIDEVE